MLTHFLAAALLLAHTGARPLVAVVGDNEGTEVTDFVIPYGVLKQSGAAEVIDVGVHPGKVDMMPGGLTLQPSESIASFDAKHPEGADYIIVPAIHRTEEPTLLAWLQAQAKGGAHIVGVCDGVWVVANAGLLENHDATGHWYSMSGLEEKFPQTHWVRNQRYVRDGAVTTTTGVTASLPMSLALVEEIAGSERAHEVAHELGVTSWDAHHQSDLYQLDAGHIGTIARNWLGFWRWERVGVPVASGVDEISLSLTADALGRTYRATSVTVAPDTTPLVTKRGLTIIPEALAAASVDRVVEAPADPPAQALDRTLAGIAAVGVLALVVGAFAAGRMMGGTRARAAANATTGAARARARESGRIVVLGASTSPPPLSSTSPSARAASARSAASAGPAWLAARGPASAQYAAQGRG